MGSVHLAVTLDLEMLWRNGAVLHDALARAEDMPDLTPAQLATQLGGRPLLRYLLAHQAEEARTGRAGVVYATPTPMDPLEVAPANATPAVDRTRPFVLLLDPLLLAGVRGPRRVRQGFGIEYILTRGFSPDAVVPVSNDFGCVGRWALAVR